MSSPVSTSGTAVVVDLSTLSCRDAYDLAMLIEQEAWERYLDFAGQMEVHRNDEARRFFLFMADNEEKHHQALAHTRHARFGDEPTKVGRHMLYDVEAPEYHEVYGFMTVREALETAMRAEVKAHDFFVGAIRGLKDPEVIALFTELAEEELLHQALVREQLERLPAEPRHRAEDYADEPQTID
jgi:erythrin-vacuolar iron transport family protein